MEKTGILYIVPTPIGNLKDITIRALETLKSVYLIAAEDTRITKKLLNEYAINTKFVSYHKFNEKKRVKELIEILRQGKSIAVVSDAGTPGISDPGLIIVRECIKNNIVVQTLPGATSFVPALVNSGFDISNFFFVGFPPRKKNDLDNLLEHLKTINSVIIFFESAQRIKKTLVEIYNRLGERKIYIAREISKYYETDYRGFLSEILKNWQIKEKGEFVIVLDRNKDLSFTDFDELVKIILKKVENGESESAAIRLVAKVNGVSKNKLYRYFYQKIKETN